MAKVLLINSNRFKHPWPVIPFGLCYIATALETNGNHKVDFSIYVFLKIVKRIYERQLRNFFPILLV